MDQKSEGAAKHETSHAAQSDTSTQGSACLKMQQQQAQQSMAALQAMLRPLPSSETRPMLSAQQQAAVMQAQSKAAACLAKILQPGTHAQSTSQQLALLSHLFADQQKAMARLVVTRQEAGMTLVQQSLNTLAYTSQISQGTLARMASLRDKVKAALGDVAGQEMHPEWPKAS